MIKIKTLSIVFCLIIKLSTKSYAQFDITNCISENEHYDGKLNFLLDTVYSIPFGKAIGNLSLDQEGCGLTMSVSAFDIDMNQSIYILNINVILKYSPNNKVLWKYNIEKSQVLDMKVIADKLFLYVEDFINSKNNYFVIVIDANTGKTRSKHDVTIYENSRSAGGTFFYGCNLILGRLDMVRFYSSKSFPYLSESLLLGLKPAKNQKIPILLSSTKVKYSSFSNFQRILFPNITDTGSAFLNSILSHTAMKGYAGQTEDYLFYSCSCDETKLGNNCDKNNSFDWWIYNKKTGKSRFIEKESELKALGFLGSAQFKEYNDTTVFYYNEVMNNSSTPIKAQFIKMSFNP